MLKKIEERIAFGQNSVVGMPAALSFALSRNVSAMRSFVELPEEKRSSFVEGARQISTVKEMKRYVADINKTKKIR